LYFVQQTGVLSPDHTPTVTRLSVSLCVFRAPLHLSSALLDRCGVDGLAAGLEAAVVPGLLKRVKGDGVCDDRLCRLRSTQDRGEAGVEGTNR
jgi:hypothetical protein